MDIVAHVGAVRLQDLYQGGGGGQGEALGGSGVRHAETQAQTAHDDNSSTISLIKIQSSASISIILQCQLKHSVSKF